MVYKPVIGRKLGRMPCFNKNGYLPGLSLSTQKSINSRFLSGRRRHRHAA